MSHFHVLLVEWGKGGRVCGCAGVCRGCAVREWVCSARAAVEVDTAADRPAAGPNQGPPLGSLLTGAGLLSPGLPDSRGLRQASRCPDHPEGRGCPALPRLDVPPGFPVLSRAEQLG